MKPKHKKPSRSKMGLGLFTNPFKKPVHNHGDANPAPENIEIYTVAVILDGKVWEVLRAQDRLADMFLANPTFVLVTEETGAAKIGMKYEDEEFKEA